MNDENRKIEFLMDSLKKDPLLEDEEKLLNDIINSVENSEQHSLKFKRTRVLAIFIKATKVASVLLLFTFGVEQFIVINKIINLEKTASQSIIENPYDLRTKARFNLGTGIYNNNAKAMIINEDNNNLWRKLKIARTSAFIHLNFRNKQITATNYR